MARTACSAWMAPTGSSAETERIFSTVAKGLTNSLAEMARTILIGGLGEDELTGGRGDDIFVFALGEGTDTVLDYEVGKDLIGLEGLTFGDLSIGQAGDDATIVANGELLAILSGVESSGLSEADFFDFV